MVILKEMSGVLLVIMIGSVFKRRNRWIASFRGPNKQLPGSAITFCARRETDGGQNHHPIMAGDYASSALSGSSVHQEKGSHRAKKDTDVSMLNSDFSNLVTR